MKSAFGMVEVTGLALAITVADVMAKSANIKILGLERVNGFGWILIKVAGDVGSVNAAVDTGASFARAQQGLCGSKVIARPADGLDRLLNEPPKLKSNSFKGVENQSTQKAKAIALENAGHKKAPTKRTTAKSTNVKSTTVKSTPTRQQKNIQPAAAAQTEETEKGTLQGKQRQPSTKSPAASSNSKAGTVSNKEGSAV
ncbi:BMC domain-containing protein [Photobacterium sp. DNB23_23_1]